MLTTLLIALQINAHTMLKRARSRCGYWLSFLKILALIGGERIHSHTHVDNARLLAGLVGLVDYGPADAVGAEV